MSATNGKNKNTSNKRADEPCLLQTDEPELKRTDDIKMQQKDRIKRSAS